MWKHFENNGHFSQSYSYGLMLNVDWMEPFEHSIYSVGVIYLSLLNLPREISYAQENIIICGLIPGPKEPSYNINSFLEPLVTDLLCLWRGIDVILPYGKLKIRAALICVACDSPATRKVGGFLSHTAKNGCFRYHKTFPCERFGKKSDYSGFDRENWISRTHAECFALGTKHKHAKTASDQISIEKEHGICYTVLINLPYYNAVEFCIVDSMHNLLLGSAKKFIELWKKSDGVGFSQLEIIQQTIDQFTVPAGIGQFPRKVEGGSGFSNFKAEEWKNWVLIYSLIYFKPILNVELYSLWVVFTHACALLCSRAITSSNINRADHLIHRYCCMFEGIFRKENCYPNLHLHYHLKNCLFDYGPSSSFWLFGFDGVLGRGQQLKFNFSESLSASNK